MSDHSKMIVSKDTKMNFSARHWLVIVMGFFALFFCGSVQNESMNVVIPKLMETHQGWTDGQISLISTAATLIGALFVFVWGALSEKYGAKKFAILAIFLSVIGFASTGFVDSVITYAIFRVITVLGTLSTMNYFVAVIATNWFPTKKGIALGYITVGNNVASMLAIWMITIAWNQFGFGGGSVVYACIGLIPILILAICLTEYPEQCGEFPDSDKNMTKEEADRLLEEGRKYEETSKWTVGKLLCTPQVWKIGICLGLMCLTISGILTHLVPMFISHGFDETTAMLGMTIVSAIAIPLSILLGVLDSKAGSKKATAVLAIVMAVCFFLSLLPTKFAVVFAAFAAAADMGCLNNVATSLPASIFGRYDLKRAQSVILPIMQVLQAIGVGLTGVLADATGGFTVVLGVMGVCSIVALIVLLTLKDECIGRTDI